MKKSGRNLETKRPGCGFDSVTRRRRVALLIETSNAYARGLLEGIVAYMRENRRWSVYLPEHSRGDRPPSWLAEWSGDGVIARIENAAIARALTRLGLPTVDVSAARLIPSLPWVETDNAAFARAAAEHLLERGFKHFGFCADGRFTLSLEREREFSRRVREAGGTCRVCDPRAEIKADAAERLTDRIGEWLASLPRPAGVMACYDSCGLQVLDACRRCGIAVPDEIAVIGVDNDALLCSLADPPLSSVIPNTRRMGYEAAELLERMMNGEKIQAPKRLVPPLGVETRPSTDVLAIDDRGVVQAIRFIRERACDGIGVDDVLRAVPQSRRSFERRFTRLVGRTPHAEILRVRMNRAKELLAGSDLSLESVAERAGFDYPEYLSVAFKREIGITPSRYRRENRR